MEDGPYGNRDQQATITLARDEFTVRRRELYGHPEAVASTARIDVADPYGNVTTWVLDLFRLEGEVTAFVQRVTADGGSRIVIPPAVTAAITRHQAGLVTKYRRKVARRVVADRLALGKAAGIVPTHLNDPKVRAKALKARKAKAAKRRARRERKAAPTL